MPTCTIDEWLRVVHEGGVQPAKIITENVWTVGERNGRLNKFSRLGTTEQPKPTPYQQVKRLTIQQGEVGLHYDVGRILSGKGSPDPDFHKLVICHEETGARYLVYKQASIESRFFDETGRELDFEKDLREYWKNSSRITSDPPAPAVSNVSVVKLDQIVRAETGGLVWTIVRRTGPRKG